MTDFVRRVSLAVPLQPLGEGEMKSEKRIQENQYRQATLVTGVVAIMLGIALLIIGIAGVALELLALF